MWLHFYCKWPHMGCKNNKCDEAANNNNNIKHNNNNNWSVIWPNLGIHYYYYYYYYENPIKNILSRSEGFHDSLCFP